MIDSHVHLSYKSFNQVFPYIDMEEDRYKITHEGTRDKLIARMKENGVECCIEPAIDVDSNELLLDLSKEYEGFIHPAVGNHPTRCVRSSFGDFRRVSDFAEDERIVAIGETGLDYHKDRKEQYRLKQKLWFWYQINLAHKYNKPLILHIRMAAEDSVKILRRNKNKLHGGVVHCFVYGSEYAKIFTEELGFCLGIGGSLLMKEEISVPIKEAVRKTPMEFIILETDMPYVKPEKPDEFSNKKWTKARNTSLILPAVIEEIAKLKGISTDEVERITTENVRRTFNLHRETSVT